VTTPKSARRRLAQIGLDRRVQWQHRALVLDKVAEMRIVLAADRVSWLIGSLPIFKPLRIFSSDIAGFSSNSCGRRLAADLGQHGPLAFAAPNL